jgi:predicted AlkP superfamily pyrophosphatase or phosphodiesterase
MPSKQLRLARQVNKIYSLADEDSIFEAFSSCDSAARTRLNVRPGQKMLLVILLDAFRHDYLRHTRYLRSLAHTSLIGRLREPFGFCPRAAYFGGIEPSQSGFTNMFWLDPENSPFSLAKFLDLPAVRSVPSLRDSARTFVEAQARTRCAPFAASYISSMAIPFPYLHLFDVAEKAAPWDRSVGYHSVFHGLSEKGMPWFECSWPGYNQLKNATDASILEYSLRHLNGDHVLAFIHFNSLDGIGHTFAPGSGKCVQAIENLDSMVQRLVHHCSQCYDSMDLMIFGDHGMVTVAKNVDISQSLAETGLTPGRDFYYFIDSTMVRFWFVTRAARRIIAERLATIQDGYIVDDRMQQELGIAHCNPRNGELFFLAHPGIQFFPNFFQASGIPPTGMHGYHPDCPDNQALFLIHTHQQTLPGQIGIVSATQIFHTCCDLLGIDNISFDRNASAIHERQRRPDSPQFSIDSDPKITSVVQNHLSLIVDQIRETAPDAKAIILTGGFGRGEGSVISTGDSYRPLNDYDFFVACDEGLRANLKSLGSSLAVRIGIDYVDIGPVHPDWIDKLSLTLFTYDLKYGSKTIWGDESLLESIPLFAPSEIPLEEGYQLLQNRIAGLLLGLNPHMLASPHWTESESAFLIHQIAKAAMAIGDFRLLALGDYSTSYQQRLDRILSLHRALEMSDSEIKLLERAYTFKLVPNYAELSPPFKFLFTLLPHFKSAFLLALYRLLGLTGTEMKTLPEAISLWEARYAASLGAEMTALRASLALLAFSIESEFALNAGMLQEALSRSRILQSETGADRLCHLTGIDLYAELRSILLQKWEDKCH